MRALVLAAAVALAGCAQNNRTRDGGALEFDVGGIHLRVSSGAWREESGGAVIGLYLTDQPDACLAITQVPVGMSTVLTLRVAAATGEVTVVPLSGDPGGGQATASLRSATGATETARVAGTDGTISWKKNDDGTATIVAMDVGFAGDERIAAETLTMPRCR